MSPMFHASHSQRCRPGLAFFRSTPRCPSAVLALTALLFCQPVSAAVVADGQVHDLTTNNFKDAVKANAFSFVEFYAPWCGHCKKLVPEWEKTAALCKDSSVMVAKVDAIAEKSLAQEHEVESFPTLRLYRGNAKVSVKYEGARTGDKMAKWAAAKSKQTLLVQVGSGPTGVEAARKLTSDKAVGVIGLLSGKDADDDSLRKALEDISFSLNPKDLGADIPVAALADVDEATLQAIGAPPGQKLPAVALLRNFDFEEKALFQDIDSGTNHRKTFKSLTNWIAAKRVPALIPGSQQTEKFFLSDIDPGNGALMYFGEDETLRKGLHELAVQFSDEKRLKWVHLQNNDFGESLGKSVGLAKSDFPEVVLWEFGETEDADKVFRLSQQASAAAASKDSVEAFVKAWQTGQLSAEKDPVKSVTSETFDDIVIKSDKHVLVEFYAPWCGHCKSLAPEYKLVAQHYANDPDVEIVKMDATAHTHSSADIKSYPTLKLYLKGKKSSPVDGEFKSTRDKQGIINFIEKTRGSNVQSGQQEGKSGKGGSKNTEQVKTQQTASSSTPSATASAPQPKDTSGQTSTDGVWIFDDAMHPESQGQQLSHNMVNSQEGFTLVHVGDLGLLLSHGSSGARAVRRFASPAEARTYAQRAKQPVASAASAGSSEAALPCPDNPNLHSCKAWCEGVWPGDNEIRSTLGGSGCSDLSAAAAAHERPSCMCYDKEYRMQLAMCVSSCKGFLAPAGGPGPAAASGPATCSADDSSCSAALSSSTAEQTAEESMTDKRFVLYDTKYGEGFNLQREVYPRAGWVVSEANKVLDKKCGSKRSGSCARWVLVLPPWCQVVHWWTGPDHVQWKTFFDIEALKSSKVPVIEFDEYVSLIGSQRVDLVVSFETDQLKSERSKLSGGKGKFVGFAKSLGDCKTKYVKPLEFQKLPSGELQVVYAGHCDGGIAAKELKCAALDGPWPEGVADMVTSLDSNVRSVLLKNFDYLLSADNEQLDALGLRESMHFAQELRQSGDQFISTALKGEKYLAAHCRRTDFLRAREKTTPDVSNIAGKLNEVMAQQGLKQVFIATDAPDELRAELQQQVKGSVVFYDANHGAAQFDHKGKQAIVETWIAARADFFIGTIESRFTMSIQLERSFLGKPHKTSEQEFCKSFKAGKKPCLSPAYRHRSSPGKYREPYLNSR